MNHKIRSWWTAAGIRAVKTLAQAAIAGIGCAAVMGEVDWIAVMSTALLAAILSLLTSVAGLPELENTSSGPSGRLPLEGTAEKEEGGE